MTQVLRPATDVDAGTWTASAAGSLASQLDEEVGTGDTTYITSPSGAGPNSVTLALGSGAAPGAGTVSLKLRLSQPGANTTLVTVADMSLAGGFGLPFEGPADGTSTVDNNHMSYATGPSFLRTVGGQTRIVMGTFGGTPDPAYNQSWKIGDLIEFALPGTFATTRTEMQVVAQATPTRRWRKNDWQGIGVKERESSVVPGGCWWDEQNDILWYQVFPYYSTGPYAHLFAVKLNDPTSGTIGTCTRYGPWVYGTDPWGGAAEWKRTVMYLAEIPASERSAFANRTHLVGNTPASIGGPSHWGLGLTAINLPALTAEVSGTSGVTGTTGSNVITITTATHDLSTVPTDGTAAIYICFSDAQAAIYTVPSSIVKSGNTYTITGDKTLTAGQAAAVDGAWSVVRRWGDLGVHVADFSPATSGKSFPYYFQKRPADYYSTSAIYDVADDPYVATRTGFGTTAITDPQVSLKPQAVGSNTLTLHASASSTNGQYVGQFVRWAAPLASADRLHYKATRLITAYNGTTKVATLDAAWAADATPTTNDTYSIIAGTGTHPGGLGTSTAIPDKIGSEGFWQASMDAATGCLFLKGATKKGVLFFGRQAYGGTWYRYWDNFAYWDAVALAGIADANSYSYHAEHYRPVIWEYNPTHLAEATTLGGSRPNNRDGMEVQNVGSWYTLTSDLYVPFRAHPGYTDKSLEDRSYWFQYPAEGNCSNMHWDAANSRIIWVCPQQYKAGNIYFSLPFVYVINVSL